MQKSNLLKIISKCCSGVNMLSSKVIQKDLLLKLAREPYKSEWSFFFALWYAITLFAIDLSHIDNSVFLHWVNFVIFHCSQQYFSFFVYFHFFRYLQLSEVIHKPSKVFIEVIKLSWRQSSVSMNLLQLVQSHLNTIQNHSEPSANSGQ